MSDTATGQIRRIWCPECRGRLCDLVDCKHKYKVVFDGSGEYFIIIKCRKCGKVIGVGIK